MTEPRPPFETEPERRGPVVMLRLLARPLKAWRTRQRIARRLTELQTSRLPPRVRWSPSARLLVLDWG